MFHIWRILPDYAAADFSGADYYRYLFLYLEVGGFPGAAIVLEQTGDLHHQYGVKDVLGSLLAVGLGRDVRYGGIVFAAGLHSFRDVPKVSGGRRGHVGPEGLKETADFLIKGLQSWEISRFYPESAQIPVQPLKKFRQPSQTLAGTACAA